MLFVFVVNKNNDWQNKTLENPQKNKLFALPWLVTRKSTKLTWTKVRHVLWGRDGNMNSAVDGISAQTLNDHYAAISTDHS